MNMVHSTLHRASRKLLGPVAKSIREIYPAIAVAASATQFAAFACGLEYTKLVMIRAQRNSWKEFVPPLEIPVELRRVVYTTNAGESLNARFR